MLRRNFLHSLLLCCTLVSALLSQQQNAHAKEVNIDAQQRIALAKSFVSKMKKGLKQADKLLGVSISPARGASYPDGEILLLQPLLGRNFRVQGVVLGEVQNQRVYLSLQDFADTLSLAIDVDAQSGNATGWYLREDKEFSLDASSGVVKTDQGQFSASDDILLRDGDVYVAVNALALWLGVDVSMKPSEQEMVINSDILFPALAKKNRLNDKRKMASNSVGEPELPLKEGQGYQLLGVPVVDVTTSSIYRKDGGSDEGVDTHSANIVTSGDVAYGNLLTRSSINDTNQLQTFRATYKQDSVDGDLLGPLKAKRFEAGDISLPTLPLDSTSRQEFGVRATNTDSLRGFSRPQTAISGVGTSGWDVELYRGTQLVAVQAIGDDGYYAFDDVDVYLNGNNFRLVFYGPQGEVREEAVFVPIDNNLLGRGEGIYDVSISLDGRNTYTKNASSEEDDDALRFIALYEKPIGPSLTASIGLRSQQDDGEYNTVGDFGLSTTALETLINAGVAVDDEGEINAELALRRDFGRHKVINTLSWVGEGFDSASGSSVDESVMSEKFRLNGPLALPFINARSSRYNLNADYSVTDSGDYTLSSSLLMNAVGRYVSVNGQLTYSEGSSLDESLDAFLSSDITYRDHKLRLRANYDIVPDAELSSISAVYHRDIGRDIDLEFGVENSILNSTTEYSARMDWKAGFARISPTISYDTEDDFYAGLSTRFSLLKDPNSNGVEILDQTLNNSGVMSVFVFLDKDGNGIFDGDDEPLPDINVTAPQSSRRVFTAENGVALFSGMTKLRMTDVFIDKDTLHDPSWVPGFDGASILPREGFVAQLDFPIHMSGEIDGVIYSKATPLPKELRSDGYTETKPVYMRNVGVVLYNEKGEVEQSVFSDATGFYYFTAVPPGRYFMMLDEVSAKKKNIVRPEPIPIEIGYEGTVIYGKDISIRFGKGDVPNEFVTDMDDYKSRHPHIDFDQDYDLVLSLGDYNSRLLMSVVWYKLQSRFAPMLEGTSLFVPPAQSYADVRTGKHVLRVGLKRHDISDAYKRCRALMAREQYCKVEIYPGFMKQAKAESGDAQPVTQ